MFDEVQTGWGATGRMWAHELFDLPSPPDVVIWAKKAQNGVLFVSEELATFFQEEKKFNTTWEGDSVGMVRLLAMLDKLDLEQVRRTGALARAGSKRLRATYSGLIENVRGAGVMLGFDVARADWRDVLRDRAFRRGLVMLPAGERALRFYPRYDTEPYAHRRGARHPDKRPWRTWSAGERRAVAARAARSASARSSARSRALEVVDIDAANFAEHKPQIMAVEIERYGCVQTYPDDVLQAGHGRCSSSRPRCSRPRSRTRGPLASRCATASRTPRRVRARQRAREPRRGRRVVGPASRRQQHVLSPRHGDAAIGAEPRSRSKTCCSSWLRDRARWPRLRVHLGAHRGARAPDRPGVAPRGAGAPDDRQLSSQRRPLRLPAACARETTRCRARRRPSEPLDADGTMSDIHACGSITGTRTPAAARPCEVENPATEETIGSVPRAQAADVGARRRACAGRTARVAAHARARQGEAAARGRGAHARHGHQELAETMTLEGGKPMIENLDEIEWTAACFDYYAEIGRHSRGNSIPPGLRASGELHGQGAVRRRGRDRAVQLPAAADGVEGRAGARGRATPSSSSRPKRRRSRRSQLAQAFEVLPPGVVEIVTGTGRKREKPSCDTRTSI